ncbi:ATP-binding cassette domain-containing protein (plasmid) [Rhizobium leguminosarum]|nr:ATP-binding cassette domain-containing protein [Rhizobium leguminosarum]
MLREISLDIRAGEILVLLGPNGAGKSTFLNIIGGTLPASSGTMTLNGQRIDFDSYIAGAARANGIQRVFQELSTFANLTVGENLALTSHQRTATSRRELMRIARERLQVFPGNLIDVSAEVSGTVSG